MKRRRTVPKLQAQLDAQGGGSECKKRKREQEEDEGREGGGTSDNSEAYYPSTCIPRSGWMAPCKYCRLWTAGTIQTADGQDVPICNRCKPRLMCYLASVVDARAVEIVHVANRQVQLPQQRGGSSDGSSDLQSTLPRCDSAVSSYDGALGGPSPYPLLPQNGLQDAQSCFMLHSSSSSALQPAYEQLLHAQAPEAVPAKQACSPGGPSALASPQREPGAGAEGKGERADSMVSSYTAGALLMV